MVPKALQERPKVKAHLAYLLEAFHDLSSQRLVSQFPQPIQISEVMAYASLIGMDTPAERERLLDTVRILDAIYLEEIRKASAPK